jgi:hypothetical protein
MIHIVLWFLVAMGVGWQAERTDGWPSVLSAAFIGFCFIIFLDETFEIRLLVPEHMRLIITGAYMSGLSLGFGLARSKD